MRSVLWLGLLGVGAGSQDRLCGTQAQKERFLIASRCDLSAQGKASTRWESCCAFGNINPEAQCRTLEMMGQYCSECDVDENGRCKSLNKHDTLTLTVKFEQFPPDQTCCKTCTCFGDPECVSFNGTKDLWIPCDARRTGSGGCMPTKSSCLEQVGPRGVLAANQGGRACQWLREDRDDAKKWPMQMYGSPCQPADIDKDPITMKMYESQDGSLQIDLRLGERGIIREIRIQSLKIAYSMDSQSCFDQAGVSAWSGSKMPPGSSENRSPLGTEVSWTLFDQASGTFIKFNCVRAIANGLNGLPRINVQEVTVNRDAGGSGFCVTGSISDKSGSVDSSNGIHQGCTMDVPDSLQACKNLVNAALTANDLELCSVQFCTQSSRDDVAACIKNMGNGNKDSAWLSEYCNAISHQKLATVNMCREKTLLNGFTWAVIEWGDGKRSVDPSPTPGCNDPLSSYLVSNKKPCQDGAFVDVFINGEWVPKLFIPVDRPPCGDKLVISGSDPLANDLFSHSIRFRQCDAKMDIACAAASPCQSTWGVELSAEFNSLPRTLVSLYESGALKCAEEKGGSSTWCLPNAADYIPADSCVCTAPVTPVDPDPPVFIGRLLR